MLTAGRKVLACFSKNKITHMKTINKIQILIIVLFCSGFYNEGTLVVDANSSLVIRGATNISRFTCSVESYGGHDTLHYFNNYVSSELQFASNRMTIPIVNFDCGSRQISRDFRETLKSDQHPHLNIRFISLSGNSIINQKQINGRMDITLAGVTRRYTVAFITSITNGDVVLSGKQAVNFADFNLKAPEKFSGMIRVRNTLYVEFYLVLKPA
jgi:hypothetical protein